MTKRFLIGQLERFGDCLYATTLARQIKTDYPESRITWAVLSKYKSILELNPHVDEIWEINPASEDFYGAIWQNFEKEALRRKANDDFDEIIFSQISPRNWARYDGTIRGTILNAYEKPITVSVAPVVRLSETEVQNVKNFAEKYKLRDFKHVVLFENSPGSRQSKVNPEFALKVARKVTEKTSDVCFVMSGSKKSNSDDANIIDAGELSFRENAELTKHCSLLVGSSSGISWLATSDWAKKIPTVQLLDAKLPIFAGMHYDFEINELDNSHIIEILNFDEQRAADCILSVLENGIEVAKKSFHQTYKPSYYDLKNVTKMLVGERKSPREIFAFIRNYVKKNAANGNKISPKYRYLFPYAFGYALIYRHIKKPESKSYFYLSKALKAVKFLKSSLWKKSH